MVFSTPIVTNYLVNMLVEKLGEMTSYAINQIENYCVYKKLLNLILTIGDEKVIDYIETLIARSKNAEYMLPLIEEQIKCGYSTDKSEKLFLEICDYQYSISFDVIERFLHITGKNYNVLTTQILNCKLHDLLENLINFQSVDSKLIILNDIIPTIINYHHDDNNDMIKVAIQTIGITSEFNADWIKFLTYDVLTKQLLKNYFLNLKQIICFSEYLLDLDSDKLHEFQIRFIKSADSHSLVRYSKEFTSSNKRLILRQLIHKCINVKPDQDLVEFIRTFPEFKSLMPML